MSRINVMQPWLGPEEIAAVSEVIASGWVAQGPRVAAFESAFAEAMQVEHAVAASSCTTALHLALVVAGVQAGDDVVVPSFSFIATANAPVYVGARPVFADVDPVTGNLTAATVEAALTDATRAVIVVDQGGVPVDLDAIRAITDPRGIVVVEDAACGAGSTYRGRPVGAGADVAAWSFHPRKIVTTGEGGMLTTPARRVGAAGSTPARARDERVCRRPARQRARAAGGVPRGRLQLPDDRPAGRRRDRPAGPAAGGRRPPPRDRRDATPSRSPTSPVCAPSRDPAWGTCNFQSFWVEVGPEFPLDRDGLLAHLAAADISARRGIMATHRQPAYAGATHAPLPVTEHLTDTTLILPVFHQMSESEQARVVDALRSAGT